MKLICYFFVGASAASVDFSLLFLLSTVFGWHWFSAAACSFLLATLTNYFLSIRYVFTSGVRFSKKAEITWVFLVSTIGLCLNQLVLWHLIEHLGFSLFFAKVIATASVFFANFFLRHFFIFAVPNNQTS